MNRLNSLYKCYTLEYQKQILSNYKDFFINTVNAKMARSSVRTSVEAHFLIFFRSLRALPRVPGQRKVAGPLPGSLGSNGVGPLGSGPKRSRGLHEPSRSLQESSKTPQETVWMLYTLRVAGGARRNIDFDLQIGLSDLKNHLKQLNKR